MRRLFALILSLAIGQEPLGVGGTQDLKAELLAGIQQIDEGHLQDAVVALDAVITRMKATPAAAADLTQALVYKGVALIGLAQEEPAKTAFREALLINPELRLSREQFSPRVLRIFEAAREGKEKSVLMPPSSTAKKAGLEGATILAIVGGTALVAGGAAIAAGGSSPPPPATPTQALPATPTQLAPPDGTVFSHFPRDTTLTWTPVQGATSYWVEVEFCQPPQCVDFFTTPLRRQNVSTTSYSFTFIGSQPGRWRVWAVGPSGLESPKSPWWVFFFTFSVAIGPDVVAGRGVLLAPRYFLRSCAPDSQRFRRTASSLRSTASSERWPDLIVTTRRSGSKSG